MAAPKEFHVRVKVFFENFAVQPTWLLVVEKETRTIKKLCKLLYKKFIGEKTHLELYLEGCRIPKWESTRILHDNDNIFVRASERWKQNQRNAFTLRERESKQYTKKKKRKLVSIEATEKEHRKGNGEEKGHTKTIEAKKRKLDEDTPVSANKKIPRRLKNFSVGHILQTQVLGKNVSFSDERKVTSVTEDVPECTIDNVNEDQRENELAMDKHPEATEENISSGGNATPTARKRRKRKRTRRRKKPLEGQNDSSIPDLGEGVKKSNDLDISQTWIDAPVHVKPPRTFRVNQETYNSVGSYKKFDSDDEYEESVKNIEMMDSSTPKEGQMSVKDSNSFTSDNQHQNYKMQALSYSSDFQETYNNKSKNKNWNENNNTTNFVNRICDDSRTSQNGGLQESISSDLQETWQWGKGTSDQNVDFISKNNYKDSQLQDENIAEPEIVKSVLANGVAVYTRRRIQGRRSYTEMSKTQQLNTKLTNKSIVLKNSEEVPETTAVQKQSSSSSSSSSSSEDSSDEESVMKPSQKQASDAGNHKILKLVAIPVFRDYSRFPSLNGPPREGDTIAYKILEMSSSYTPEVSDYKEALVVKYDHNLKTVELKPQQQLSKKDRSGKFEIDIDEDGDFTWNTDLNDDGNHTLQWTSLLDPRLVTD